MAPEVHAQMLRTGRVPLPQHHLRPGGQEPHPSAVISAEPQV